MRRAPDVTPQPQNEQDGWVRIPASANYKITVEIYKGADDEDSDGGMYQ